MTPKTQKNTPKRPQNTPQAPFLATLFTLFLLLTPTPAPAQTIRLSAKATVDPAAPVQLGHVATITAADPILAEKLATTVLLKEAAPTRLKSDDILFAILAQHTATTPNLASHLQLTGAAECALEAPAQPAPAQTTTATNRAARLDPPAQPAQAPNQQATPDARGPIPDTRLSLADLLRQQVSESLAVSPDDLRITFETVNPLLDQPLAPGQRWTTRPLARTFLGTVQWEAQLATTPTTAPATPPKPAARLTVQARILRRTQAIVCDRVLVKGDIIAPDMIHPEDRWIDRQLPTWFAKTNDIIGQEAQRAIAVGSPLDQRDFKPLELAARGDEIRVFYAAGNLRLKLAARALAAGKLHDRIPLRNASTGEKFEATLIGKHLAVVGETDPKTEKQLREER